MTRRCDRAVRQQCLLGRAVHEAVRDLVAEHPGAEHVLCRAPAIERAVAEADLGDESVLLQVTHGADGPPKGARPPRLMDLVEVDPRSTQPARTGGGVPPHRRADGARRVELGRHERRARVLNQCLAQDAFAAPEAAEPRRVDDGNAAH